MSNYVNYCGHVLNDPTYYQRNYEHDFPKEEKAEEHVGWMQQAQRVTLLAVPFLSLCKPLGSCISLSMGAVRCVTHIRSLVIAGTSGERASEMLQVALAVVALVGTIFRFTIGQVITTGADLTLSLVHCVQHLLAKEYDKAFEELLSAISSAFYLAIMLTGSLEINLISILVQGILSLYQARREFCKGRYPEAIAKVLMGLIRFNQAKNCYFQIERRNMLFALKQFQQIRERVQKAREVGHLIKNPLNDLSRRIAERRVILEDAKENKYDFGAHFHGYGKALVKGENLTFRTKEIDGEDITELDFKVNHVFRDRMQGAIEELASLNKEELQEVLAFSNSHLKGITISAVPFEISQQLNLGAAYEIAFEGMGKILVGASIEFPNLFDRVIVRMDEGTNIYDLHEMLSFIDLDDTVRLSDPDDIERLKIGQLFRVFFPKEATLFERTEEFFTLSIEELKRKIIEQVPDMQALFEEYLPKMEAREILPGEIRYVVAGLAEKARDLGARALTAALTGVYTEEELFERVASIIKMGMLSSETRYTSEMGVGGLSPSFDFFTGAADSVFTQLITEKDCKDQIWLSDFYYYSKVRLLFSLDLLETGTYQYHYDSFGIRRTEDELYGEIYKGRPGILDFVSQENADFYPENEVMIKERIPPSLIEGLIVQDEQTRDKMLDYLRTCHLVELNTSGQETILGISIDRFIRAASCLSEELIA